MRGRRVPFAVLTAMLVFGACWIPVGLGLPIGASPVTLEDYHDIRPGAPILPEYYVDVHTLHGEPRAYTCTANFVFRDDDGNRYLGTAGHCASFSSEDRVQTWAYPQGPVAHDINGEPIGRFVYASYLLGESQVQDLLGPTVPAIDRPWISDFALIRIDEGVPVDPQMAHFGGPTGINDDLSPLPVVLHVYGWGILGTPAFDLPGSNGTAFEIPAHGRTFVAPGMPDPHVVRWVGATGGGDSGSPVISMDGRAVGVHVALNFMQDAGTGGADAGNVLIVRIGPELERAQENLGFPLTLMTAPLRTIV